MTLDEVIAARMPAGTQVAQCLLCPWVYPMPGPGQPGVAVPPSRRDAYLAALAEGPSGNPVAEAAFEQLLRHSLAADDVIEKHLRTHSPLEWVAEVQRLREAIDLAAIALSDSGQIGAFIRSAVAPGSPVAAARLECLDRLRRDTVAE